MCNKHRPRPFKNSMKFSSLPVMGIVVTAAAFLLLTTGCKKSNSGGSSAVGISATVNGSGWANSYPVVGVYFSGGYDFDIVGTQVKNGDTTGFELIFYTPITLNKAVACDTSQVVVSFLDGKTGNGYNGDFGSSHAVLTVTSYDSVANKVAGTFSGVLYDIAGTSDSIVVTNGKFNTTYQVQ